MTTWTTDDYVRESVIIVFLWLVGMLVAGLALIKYGGAIQSLFA